MLDTKQTLQDNLKALLATRPDTSRLNLSREMKVADGTLGLIQYGKGNPTLEVLETIARFFELETWQLLSPDLGQSKAAAKTGVRSGNLRRWPFAAINPADFDALPSDDRCEIEHQIAYKVKRLKENSVRKKRA
ncbi:hypothetical protein L0Z32_06560 [Burkholderia multivorans]|uniref:hypothetical protein n=1 Tax=Burkholderia multivorans TaxID=87883 RepID=UPI0011B26DFF|nr:hypothetical protein [Burkholderia multivorans]MCL4626077.1 hypothetical protein [Burkholderia multivorans]